MITADPMTTIRSLKGPGLAVLLVLLMHKGQAMKAEDLQTWTGYADKAVTQALKVLRYQGVVVRGPRGFSLVDQFDMWIFAHRANRENHDLPDPLLLLNPSEEESLLINNNNKEQIVKITISHKTCGKPVDNLAQPVDNFLSEVLESYGIVEPKRSQLAAIEGLSEEAIREVVRSLKVQVGERFTSGLLVHVLESGAWRATAQALTQGRDRYTGGEFGAFVEH